MATDSAWMFQQIWALLLKQQAALTLISQRLDIVDLSIAEADDQLNSINANIGGIDAGLQSFRAEADAIKLRLDQLVQLFAPPSFTGVQIVFGIPVNNKE